MSLLCSLGIHQWMYTPATYSSIAEKRLGIPATEMTRCCVACAKQQLRDEHCLGINPPEYHYTWYSK
jgi:hypothetical protein